MPSARRAPSLAPASWTPLSAAHRPKLSFWKRMFTEEDVPTHDGEGGLREVRHPKEVVKDCSVAGLRDGANKIEIVVVDVARVSVGVAARDSTGQVAELAAGHPRVGVRPEGISKWLARRCVQRNRWSVALTRRTRCSTSESRGQRPSPTGSASSPRPGRQSPSTAQPSRRSPRSTRDGSGLCADRA